MHGRDKIRALAFHPDGRHIPSGGVEGNVRQWDVEDGQEVGDAMVARSSISAIAVSKDGRWIVSVGGYGTVIIWNTETHKKVAEAVGHTTDVVMVDMSPLSTTFATGSYDRSAIVWDIETGKKRIGSLRHEGPVYAVKFSRTGDRIATAQSFPAPIRIFDSRTGELLVKTQIDIDVRSGPNIVWLDGDQLIYATSTSFHKNNSILVLDSWTGSLLSEWPIQGTPFKDPRLASSEDTDLLVLHSDGHLSFWDVATKNRIASIVEHAADFWTMVLSPDNRYLASGGEDKRITIRRLRDIIPQSYLDHGEATLRNVDHGMIASGSRSRDEQNTILHPAGNIVSHLPNSTLGITCLLRPHLQPGPRLPLLHVSNAVFKLWIRDDLTGAAATLTEEIARASDDTHQELASRALIRARSQDWRAAIDDATEVTLYQLIRVLVLTTVPSQSIKIQRSTMGHIAMAIARIGSGEREAGFREFNFAFERCDPQYIDFLLLIKACVLCGTLRYHSLSSSVLPCARTGIMKKGYSTSTIWSPG